MENYIQVDDVDEKPSVNLQPHELEILPKSRFSQDVKVATRILKTEGKIVIIGKGSTITRAVNIAEELKAKYKKIYQKNQCSTFDIKDVWVPKSEDMGLESLEVIRHIPLMSITLSNEYLENSVSVKEERKCNNEMLDLLKKEARNMRNNPSSSANKSSNTSRPKHVQS